MTTFLVASKSGFGATSAHSKTRASSFIGRTYLRKSAAGVGVSSAHGGRTERGGRGAKEGWG